MNAIRLLGTICLLVLTLPAVADILALRDGGRVVTAGRWSVDGSVVVFTRPDGSLASIRLKSVDLKASGSSDLGRGRAGTGSLSEHLESAEPTREPVLVLTDRDVPKATPDSVASNPASGSSATSRRSSPVRVETWVEIEGADGYEIVGHLRNRGRVGERVYRVSVDLRGRDGKLVQSAMALPRQSVLEKGAATTFRARFRDVAERKVRPSFKVDSVRATVGSD